MNTNLHLKVSHPSLFFSAGNAFQTRPFRLYKRRRIKRTARKLTLCIHLLDPFQSFLSQFPSPTSLDFVAPALGLASGLTLYLSQFKSNQSFRTSDIGQWILFTSPTPFNRFVLLRCHSISFEGSELLEDVNEKLVLEDRHFVRLNSGRIQVKESGVGRLEEKLEYQRVCVSTEDGGVISLDWPANLDLKEEHGLDTTLLLVPGTAGGSMDENVRSFVCESLIRGFFPVVMNPRGCAGSPLTTARLFTAADSDDTSTAVQFINKARPWTTLMGVGWGYGANMLTKYLSEVGERTPLTAATCINNPFDLEEATRCSPYHIALDQKLTGGLIDILRSNKELFQGRAKGFDVEKALVANSVRDFEKLISMVSYGFDKIEDFYSKSSTQAGVSNIKIPVLFIQNDDGTVPLFSIPRSLIAENPFTSLLLCSCMPSSVFSSSRASVSWCQNLTIEWLAAVELGLLKGRHPLLKDIDVTINPSKGLAFTETRSSGKGVKPNKLLDLTPTDVNGYSVDPMKDMIKDSDTAVSFHSTFRQDSQRNLEFEKELQEVGNGSLQQISSVDPELVNEVTEDPVDTERGEVIQTAEVVMSMLDATMPGTLSEEEKKKVFSAVSQGETLMKALQDAVPEDVREKLTTAVSGILHAQRANLKIGGLLSIHKIPNVSSGFKSKIEEKVRVSSSEGNAPHSTEQVTRANDLADCSANNHLASDKSGAGQEPEFHPSENMQKSIDLVQSQAMSSQQGDTSGSVRKNTSESGDNHESDEFIKDEKGLETSSKPNSTSCSEKAGGTEEAVVDVYKVDKDGGEAQPETRKESNTQKDENVDSSADQNKMVSANVTEEALPSAGSSPDYEAMEREGNDNQKRENKTVQPVHDQSNPGMPDSNSSAFSVSQALDALTGMDDSTQMAVNSVFSVIENMISHFEEEKANENKVDRNQGGDESIDSASKAQPTSGDHQLKITENDEQMEPDEHHENSMLINQQNAASTGWIEEEPVKNPILFSGNGAHGSEGNTDTSQNCKEEKNKNEFADSKLLADYADRQVHNVPGYITGTPYGGCTYKDHFQRYLVSKIPSTKSLDLDTTTALLLDYFPEEGQWMLLEQPGIIGESIDDVISHSGVDKKVQGHCPSKVDDTDNCIEPSYIVLDTEKQQEPVEEYNKMDNFNENEHDNDRLEESMLFVKTVVLDALRVEVSRKLSAAGMKQMESDLAGDLEEVANAVSLAVGHGKDHTWCLPGKDSNMRSSSGKVGTLQGKHVIRAISSAIQRANYLRRVLPVGVIVGSSFATLRKYFDVATTCDNGLKSLDQTKKSRDKSQDNISVKEMDQKFTTRNEKTTGLNNTRGEEKIDGFKNTNNDGVMVGAVTAALGASALLVQQQNLFEGKHTAESSSKSFKERENNQKAADKFDDSMSEKNQNNVITSLAEKALSVAGPVVPTKEDGEVDQERLVAMLADLGQKGGILRLVGKIALLWGGIRGAMSLTDRLISFLHIADRPLYQRILGFAGMALVLWSPVIVPLLPTLVQGWTTSQPSRFAELVCIIGLYAAVMILVMLWGRRIRGYEDPLKQYGLDLSTLPKIRGVLKGLIGGIMLVLSIQSINALLGCLSFSLPSSLSSSSLDAMTCLKVLGKMIVLAGRGIITATGVVLVEELLFRSWLPEEIAADLGYHRAIIISGLVFSLLQRSSWAIPGLWLLSLALAGLRQRSQGSLAIPIGLRAGIMASSFVLQTGGFLTYKRNFPVWISGTHPFEPFSGAVGLAFSLLMAIVLYPRQLLQKGKKLKRIIQE